MIITTLWYHYYIIISSLLHNYYVHYYYIIITSLLHIILFAIIMYYYNFYYWPIEIKICQTSWNATRFVKLVEMPKSTELQLACRERKNGCLAEKSKQFFSDLYMLLQCKPSEHVILPISVKKLKLWILQTTQIDVLKFWMQ